MCGIFAYLNHDLSIELLKKLSAFNAKRGPEGSVFEKIDTNVFFGFHRLAINGINTESNQPLVHKHYSLICNGEIFNYKKLAEPYVLKTQSDCEVILHLYEEFGVEAFKLLDGEFSFILYDSHRKEVFVVRDPYGLKSLYVSTTENGTMFSSVLESLTHSELVQPGRIEQVTPGTYTVYTEGYGHMPKTVTYYKRPYLWINGTEEQIKQQTFTLLEDAVLKRLITSERPVCCLLSGGIDSSLICAIASRYYKNIGKTLHTFTIGMEGGEDLYYASLVAKHIQSEHHEVILSKDDFIEAIPHVIKDIESYDTTTVRASVGNWLIGKYIKEHTEFKVVLNGDGADELMGGYLYFNACKNPMDFHLECERLLDHIHFFDVLRSDKCISSHGLEPRTPFLDKHLCEYYLSIPVLYRKGKIEKEFIRNTVEYVDPALLPREVLWRKKEAFSDGVSSVNDSWFKTIQAKLHDYLPHGKLTREQSYYRDLFLLYYGTVTHLIPYYWMPRFIHSNDPSARTLYQRHIIYEYFDRVKHFLTTTVIQRFRQFLF